ncbi:MAG: PLP-dependent aminotransferase family protein [Thermomicrobiales bacterium]
MVIQTPTHPTTERRLARRARKFLPSLWNEVGDLVQLHPDPIFFGNGAPSPALIPVSQLQKAATRVWSEAGSNLGYAEAAGYAPLRQLITERMTMQGMTTPADQVMITNGSQQGIDLIAKVMLDPGDAVVIEGPTYLGAIQAFDSYEAEYLVAPMDDQGIDPDVLDRLLHDATRPPKLLYTIPTFQNPSGRTQTGERRRQLLTVARQHGLLVVEDDPYGELRFAGTPEPNLRALDPDVVYLGTFSKTIAPALRVGWTAAPADLIGPLISAREAADVHGERTAPRIVQQVARDHLDASIQRARIGYRRRRDTMLGALEATMPPGVHWNEPDGGFFIWLELPPHLDAESLLPLAASHGATYMPGGWFFHDRRPFNAARLSFSSIAEERISIGIERLAHAVQAALDA